MKIPLETADRWAEQILDELRPHCTRIEVAGSIRRRRPVVGDIDLVIQTDTPMAVRERILSSAAEIVTNGKQTLIVTLSNGVRVDAWFAHGPAGDLFGAAQRPNFGALLLTRTGSREFNIWLVSWAKRRGLQWKPNAGVFQYGRCIAAESEEAVFDALGMPIIPPEKREVGANTGAHRMAPAECASTVPPLVVHSGSEDK
jgi:DNA polymerase (family 10)